VLVEQIAPRTTHEGEHSAPFSCQPKQRYSGEGCQENEAECRSSWTNWVCNGAWGKTSGRSIVRHAPLRATSSALRRSIWWAILQTLANMHFQIEKAGSFCAWQETFTLLYRVALFDAPTFHTRRGFWPALSRQQSVPGSRIRTSTPHIGPNDFFFDIIFSPFIAPLAQLDRASGYEPEGREFESLRARHSFSGPQRIPTQLQLRQRIAISIPCEHKCGCAVICRWVTGHRCQWRFCRRQAKLNGACKSGKRCAFPASPCPGDDYGQSA
jgi:hypothetical protein